MLYLIRQFNAFLSNIITDRPGLTVAILLLFWLLCVFIAPCFLHILVCNFITCIYLCGLLLISLSEDVATVEFFFVFSIKFTQSTLSESLFEADDSFNCTQ